MSVEGGGRGEWVSLPLNIEKRRKVSGSARPHLYVLERESKLGIVEDKKGKKKFRRLRRSVRIFHSAREKGLLGIGPHNGGRGVPILQRGKLY